MKKLIIAILISVFLTGCAYHSNTNYVPDKRTRIYDAQGRYVGFTLESKYQHRVYDDKGRLQYKIYK
jgi:uncharacterized protein YcfL